MNFIEIITIVSAVLTVLLILLQQRGASLGAGFGASGELFTTRRGVEKSIFRTTIFTTVLFIVSILASIFLVK